MCDLHAQWWGRKHIAAHNYSENAEFRQQEHEQQRGRNNGGRATAAIHFRKASATTRVRTPKASPISIECRCGSYSPNWQVSNQPLHWTIHWSFAGQCPCPTFVAKCGAGRICRWTRPCTGLTPFLGVVLVEVGIVKYFATKSSLSHNKQCHCFVLQSIPLWDVDKT